MVLLGIPRKGTRRYRLPLTNVILGVITPFVAERRCNSLTFAQNAFLKTLAACRCRSATSARISTSLHRAVFLASARKRAARAPHCPDAFHHHAFDVVTLRDVAQAGLHPRQLGGRRLERLGVDIADKDRSSAGTESPDNFASDAGSAGRDQYALCHLRLSCHRCSSPSRQIWFKSPLYGPSARTRVTALKRPIDRDNRCKQQAHAPENHWRDQPRNTERAIGSIRARSRHVD